MIFDYRQRIIPNKKLPYQGQKPCRKKSWILNTLGKRMRQGNMKWEKLCNIEYLLIIICKPLEGDKGCCRLSRAFSCDAIIAIAFVIYYYSCNSRHAHCSFQKE